MSCRASVVAEVAGRVPRAERPVLVAADGVDGSGKTWFGDELATACASWPGPVVRASVDGFHHPAVHDVESDRALDLPPSVVPERGLLLVDGIFLQRDELRGYRDLVVFLDVPFEVSVPRMAARDGSDPDAAHPSQARYVAGQRIYLGTRDPRARAVVVVDNSDLAWPCIVRCNWGTPACVGTV